MNLRDRSISKYEIETLFRDVLNFDQVEQIGNLIKLLGLYVFMDRKQIDLLAERHFGQKVGLSYLRKAVQNNLISEIQADGEFEQFYFQLKLGGFIFLETIDYQHRKLPLDATRKDRERILSINDYLIDNKHVLNEKQEQPIFEPLFIREDVVLHDECLEEEIVERLKVNFDGDVEQVYKTFTFEKMVLRERLLNSKAKGNEASFL